MKKVHSPGTILTQDNGGVKVRRVNEDKTITLSYVLPSADTPASSDGRVWSRRIEEDISPSRALLSKCSKWRTFVALPSPTDGLRLIFSNTSVLRLHYFKRSYSNLHELFKVFLLFLRKINKISTLLTGETLLKTQLIVFVALENSRGERAKCFWIRTKGTQWERREDYTRGWVLDVGPSSTPLTRDNFLIQRRLPPGHSY